MDEQWRKYETLMIFDPDLGMGGVDDLVQRARDFVTQEAARILKTERWGLRDLAFELKGRRKGYYLLLEYAGLPRAATELDRRLNLIDSVLKFQTIKLAERVDPASLPENEEVIGGSEPAAEAVEPPAAAAETAPEAEEESGGEGGSGDSQEGEEAKTTEEDRDEG
jgi:small subunit ribosomal protein S6